MYLHTLLELPYVRSWKYWWEFNLELGHGNGGRNYLGIEPQIAIAENFGRF